MADPTIKSLTENMEPHVFDKTVAEGTPWKDAGIPGIPMRVVQDIRAFYEMAALGLSDHVPSAWSGTRWFFNSTKGGQVILAARSKMKETGEPMQVWFYLAPADR